MTPHDTPIRGVGPAAPAARRPRTRRRLAVLAGLLALAAATSLPPSSAAVRTAEPPAAAPAVPDTKPAATAPTTAPSPAPALPEPTGPHPVGTTSLHLVDTSRADPWVVTATARELMLTLWYPATSSRGRRAPYVTPRESALILAGTGTPAPPDALSRTRTNAVTGARPAGNRRGLPLVVLSPGFTWPRSSLTALAEDLASHGYVVAGIDHTYETFATTFPDGRVTTCAACEIESPSGEDFGRRAVESRAVDVAFVLDELTGPRPPWGGAGQIDPSRIAMVGSSLGGASATRSMLTDQRIRAGANLDGTLFSPIPETGLSRPFLLMGEESVAKPGQEPSWDRDWQRLTGWKRWLVVEGAVHPSFTDYDLLATQLGVDLGGDLPGPRSVEITRRYVRAFLDLHLRGGPQPLLDAPSPRYPEVRFCAPEAGTCA